MTFDKNLYSWIQFKMIQDLENFIQQSGLFSKKDQLLIAVSGGIDSVVLLDILIKTGYLCGIAHCNFQLRGQDSINDELFVKELSKKYQIPFFTIRFDTKNYAEEKGISIQMAARELRYKWFEKIRLQANYKFILTGHNKNDNIETFLLNIIRGTGIAGLTGIETKNKNIIRPIIFASREQITEYCFQNHLQYREDSSNQEIKYSRNKLRNQIIPLIKEINQSFDNTISDNIERFINIEKIYLDTIKSIKNKLFTINQTCVYIAISELKKLSPLNTYLYELLKEYNFTGDNIPDIVKIINSGSGKYVDSKTHRLLKDRTHLILSIKETDNKEEYLIEEFQQKIITPVTLTIKVMLNDCQLIIEKNKNIAFIDFTKIKFPLTIRKWKSGDYFYPFGMKQKKKLSDFFTDQKYTLFEKQNIWLLTSNNEIVWIIGERLDNRYRITDQTSKILQIVTE